MESSAWVNGVDHGGTSSTQNVLNAQLSVVRCHRACERVDGNELARPRCLSMNCCKGDQALSDWQNC
jgi:hypothetical protein